MKKIIVLLSYTFFVLSSFSQVVVVDKNNSFNVTDLDNEMLYEAKTLSLSGTWEQQNIDTLKDAIQSSGETSTSLLSVDMSDVTFAGSITFDEMFIGASNLVEVIFPSQESSDELSFNYTFCDCKKLLFVKNFQNFTNITDMYEAFLRCESLTYIMLSTFPTESYENAFSEVNPNALYYLPEGFEDYFSELSRNVIINDEACLDIILDSSMPYYCPQSFTTTSSAIYTYHLRHPFEEGWNTIVFPFEPVSAGDKTLTAGEIEGINDFSIAKFRGISQSNICYTKLSSWSDINANTPYILGAYDISNLLFISENNCLIPASDDVYYESIDKMKYCFSYYANELSADDYPMILNEQGTAFTFASQSEVTETKPFECYFVLEDGAKIDNSLAITTDNTIVTNVDKIEKKNDIIYASNSKIVIKSDETKILHLYNKEGQLIHLFNVKVGDNEFYTPSGLYIINNKTIFVY